MQALRPFCRHTTSLASRRYFFQQQSPAAKRHHERRLLKYPAELLFEVVSDVEKYNEFVPWCQNSVVVQRSGNKMSAELTVGFKYFTERYLSHVSFEAPKWVRAHSTQTNLFESLSTEWKFSPSQDKGSTWVTFQVDFQFRSALYNEMSSLFLNEVVQNMVKAFEQRCKYLSDKRRAARVVSCVA